MHRAHRGTPVLSKRRTKKKLNKRGQSIELTQVLALVAYHFKVNPYQLPDDEIAALWAHFDLLNEKNLLQDGIRFTTKNPA